MFYLGVMLIAFAASIFLAVPSILAIVNRRDVAPAIALNITAVLLGLLSLGMGVLLWLIALWTQMVDPE